MTDIKPVGVIRSCFREKFAIPRQPLLAPAAKGELLLLPPYDRAEAVEGLEQVSHIWILFLFHAVHQESPRLKVRPPRLGGNQSIGVFASRSTYRPNGLGQSVVRLDRVEPGILHLSGIDMLDGTPVLDIKPYVPYADCIMDASNLIAPDIPQQIEVRWKNPSLADAKWHSTRLQQPLTELIGQCLAQDPRPAYQLPENTRIYGTIFWDVEVRWHYLEAGIIEVLEVQKEKAVS